MLHLLLGQKSLMQPDAKKEDEEIDCVYSNNEKYDLKDYKCVLNV